MESIVVGYKGCVSHEPGKHMIVNPWPEFLAALKVRGLKPAANGYLEVPGACPGCKQDCVDDLMINLRIADAVGDEEAVASYATEIRGIEK